MEPKELLESLGFTGYKASIFLVLMQSKESFNAKQLSDMAGVPLARAYSVLMELEKEGVVCSVPGKVQLYKSVSAEEAFRRIKESIEQKLEKQNVEFQSKLASLNKALLNVHKKEPDVSLYYFENDPDYWLSVFEAEAKLKKGDMYRVLEGARFFWSYLKEERAANPSLDKCLKGSEKALLRGVKRRLLVNPDRFVEATMVDLEDKAAVSASIIQTLNYLKRFRKVLLVKTTPVKNMAFAIARDEVFLEFFSTNYVTPKIAVEIKGKKAVEDFSLWFDALYGDDPDPDESYEKIKKEVLRSAKEIAGIKPEEIAKHLL